jgi:MoaA/NifB/PqqE/SkfB family radical SAM enzyme
LSKLSDANPNDNKYIGLEKDVHLKQLEMPVVYKTGNDSLYEVDLGTLDFLKKCDGRSKVSELEPEIGFFEYILSENIALLSNEPEFRPHGVGVNEKPSLRYLLVEITESCNLSCKHCYQGGSQPRNLELKSISTIAEQFEAMGGLRLIISGGEPLMHPDFKEINRLMEGRAFRSILLTNATLINEDFVSSNRFDEVQVSLDGLEIGHDLLRGKGSFQRSLENIRRLRKAGISVSIASMIHADNYCEFAGLGELVRELGALSWSIDVPSKTGRLVDNDQMLPPLDQVKSIMQMQFGAEIHDSVDDLICGAHLGCVKATGAFTKCGFYENWSGGDISEGLKKCWMNLPRMRLSELECDCEFIEECKGGCRYRAECYNGKNGADPVKCLVFGAV